ncbi:MAG: T9SS type A sorting domain-containing protein [Ignavibacteriaceae bacterium]
MIIRKVFRFTVITLCLHFLLSTISSAQSWLYLGQNPPGLQPERFPPADLLATAEWNWHSAPVFSPDGTEMLFVKYYTADSKVELQYMKMENNLWTGPSSPAFANSEYNENCPIFSPTGDTLYFISARPGGWIFYTIRIGEDWTEPTALNIPFPGGSFLGWQFAFASDGSVYFEIWENGQVDIFFSEFLNGNYQTPEPLPPPLNTEYYEWGTYIDPEDNFMIFTSNRPGGYGFNDLYISVYNDNESWSDPINLGTIINSDFEDTYPLITFDGQYFFFTTQKSGDLGYNPYWVDAQVVYDLITDVEDEDSNPVDFYLSQNFPNPFNPTSKIRFQVAKQGFVSLRVYDVLGIEIAVLVNEEKSAGSYEVEFSAIGGSASGGDVYNLSSGIYFYSLVTTEFNKVKKMVLIK